MKIPYVKIYTADFLAKSRKLSPEQIGRAVVGVCEQAFENATAYKPRNEEERSFYEMLLNWKNASVSVIKSRKKAGRKGGLATQSKLKLSDGSNASPLASSKNFSLLEKRQFSDGSTAILPANGKKEKETPLEERKEKDIKEKKEVTPKEKENTYCEPAAAGLKKCRGNDNGTDTTAKSRPAHGEKGARVKTPLQEFSNAILAEFEEEMNDTQKGIWFKRNCRCLADILNFCGKNIPLAVHTVRVCVDRLDKAGLKGGYEAVCRNLPEYYAQAQKALQGATK